MTSKMSSTAKKLYRGVQQKSLENLLKRELVFNFGYDNKLAIAEVLVEKIMEIIAVYAPDRRYGWRWTKKIRRLEGKQ